LDCLGLPTPFPDTLPTFPRCLCDYLMIAARSLGLDCGPMSGFDNAKVDAEFFPDLSLSKTTTGGSFIAAGPVKSNFLCNLGYGDASKLFPRGPRLTFDEACQLL